MFLNALRSPAFVSGQKIAASALIVLAASAATPALAQSSGDEFSGFRIEALGGWDNEGVDFDDDVFDGGKRSEDGFLLGGAVGYDIQMGNWVFGAEGEFTESTGDKDYSESVLNPLLSEQISADYDVKSGGDIAIAARAGYVVMPNLLLYGKVGYSWHKLAYEGTGTVSDGEDSSDFDISERVDLGGLRLGAGAEMNFTKMFYGKLEYRYSNYNEGDFDINGNEADLDPLFRDIDVVRHQVVVGAGIRF